MHPVRDSSFIDIQGPLTDSLQPGEHIIIGNTEFEYAESSDDGSVLDRPGVGRTMDRVLDRVSAPLSVFLAQRLPLRTPSRRGHDTTHVDLTSANLEWLGPGSLITVRGIDYEYADSDASDDDAPGPGHTLGKLVKRVSAPLEMFLGLCSDLLGNGPDAIFCGLMDSEFPPPRRKGEVLRVRRRRNLVFWIRSIEGDDNPLWSGYGVVDGVIARLLPFIIDRRYHFSVRLTAAHYLLVLLARCIHTGHILPFISNILDALLRLCQEGSRRGYSAETLKPLVRTLASRDDFLRISYCGKKEVPDAVLRTTDTSMSPVVRIAQLSRLYLTWDLRTQSSVDITTRVMRTIHRDLRCPPPSATRFEVALCAVARQMYSILLPMIESAKKEVATADLAKRMQYVVPCDTGYGGRYVAGSRYQGSGDWHWKDLGIVDKT